MRNGEFEINGYRFGCDLPVKPTKFESNGLVWHVQDEENPVGDGTFFGRDRAEGGSIKMEATVTGGDPEEALAELIRFARAWHAGDRSTPGAETALTYGLRDQTRTVYGRPRDFIFDESTLFSQPRVRGTLTFDRSSILTYIGGGNELSLGLRPGRKSGFVFPLTFPWGTTEADLREGIIENGGGFLPTDNVIVSIRGPVGNPVVTGPGWSVKLNTTIAWDEVVTIDARARSIISSLRGSLGGALDRRSRLADITIPPGQSEITFGGIDTSGTAITTVAWHPATII